MTTEFTFNIPNQTNLTSELNAAFNNFVTGPCENSNNSETLEEKTEENVNEEKTEENVNEEKKEEYADEMD